MRIISSSIILSNSSPRVFTLVFFHYYYIGDVFKSYISLTLIIILDADFTTVGLSVIIPPSNSGGIQTFQLPQSFSVIDDNINEVEQSFALVAEILNVVPTTCFDNNIILTQCSCFKTELSESNCYGRTGAIEIRIRDNDCKFR